MYVSTLCSRKILYAYDNYVILYIHKVFYFTIYIKYKFYNTVIIAIKIPPSKVAGIVLSMFPKLATWN